MNNIIYTIGYASFEIDKFIEVLKKYNINCIIDVRSFPRSVYYKNFDSDNLKFLLKQHNIIYRNYKNEFGARQENREFYSKEGYLDFDVFAKSEQFKEGVKKIQLAINMHYTICLMCAEKDPLNCHRTILIARNLSKLKYNVQHITEDERLLSQGEVDQILLDKYFPNRNQVSMFENISEEEYIERAYGIKNKEIGFKLEDEE